jgi:hypothetical protein
VADIFISYSKRYPRPTRDVAAYLTSEGYSVWYDTKLISGQRFRAIIDQQLNAAKAVIVIWTKDSVRSNWVLAEADHADRDKKLIPLRTKDLDISEIPMPYSAYHTDVVDRREAILTAVRRLAGFPDTDTEPRPRLAAKRKKRDDDRGIGEAFDQRTPELESRAQNSSDSKIGMGTSELIETEFQDSVALFTISAAQTLLVPYAEIALVGFRNLITKLWEIECGDRQERLLIWALDLGSGLN